MDLYGLDALPQLVRKLQKNTACDVVSVDGLPARGSYSLGTNSPHLSGMNAARVRRSELGTHVVLAAQSDRYIDTNFAKTEGIVCGLLIALQSSQNTIVVFLGYRRLVNLVDDAQWLNGEVRSFHMALRYGFWPTRPVDDGIELLSSISDRLASESEPEDVVDHLIQGLQSQLESANRRVHIATWRVDFHDRMFVCEQTWGLDPPNGVDHQGFDDGGLIGWVARHREIVNVCVNDPNTRLSDGVTRVGDVYKKRWSNKEIQSELVLPMVYRGRLVGILNVESPNPDKFDSDFILLAQMLAVHGAQVIHQKRMHKFYRRLPQLKDPRELAQLVVREIANLMSAPFGAVYLWDAVAHQLRLAYTLQPVSGANGVRISVGDACYEEAGIGLTRWAQENRLWLNCWNVNNLDAAASSDDCKSELDRIRADIVYQLKELHQTEHVWIDERSKPDDDRLFWEVYVDGQLAEEIPQPLYSNSQHEGPDRTVNASLVVPILDGGRSGAALGVMRFSRQENENPFTRYEVDRLLGVAHHYAHAIRQHQRADQHRAERRLIPQLIAQSAGAWDQEVQNRLQPKLKEIAQACGAHIVLMRARSGNELRCVACYPPEEEILERFGVEVVKTTYVGRGGSGTSVESGCTTFIPSPNHPIAKQNLNEIRGGRQRKLVEQLKSEVAVPLKVDADSSDTSEENIVGALTAISFDESETQVLRKGNKWESVSKGLKEEHGLLLNAHASALGAAIQILRELVDRQRQSTSLATSVRELSRVLQDEVGLREFLHTITKVINHPQGIGIPQVMLAKATRSTTGWEITGSADRAWGPASLSEQEELERIPLDQFLGGASADELQQPFHFRQLWADFRFSVDTIPSKPCVVMRSKNSCRELLPPERVLAAQTGSCWDAFLDEFCNLFGADRESDLEFVKRIAVGIVPIAEGDRKGSLLCFTSKRFQRTGDGDEVVFCDPITVEAVKAVEEMGQIGRLAIQLAERESQKARIEYLQEQLPEVFHRFMEPVRAVDAQVSGAMANGNSDGRAREFVNLAFNLLKTKSETVRVSARDGIDQQKSKFLVDDLLADLVEPYECLFRLSYISFEFDIDPEARGLELEGNLRLLQSVLTTLLDNAQRAVMPRRKRDRNIRFRCSAVLSNDKETRALRVSVEDDGIPVSDPDKLFDYQESGWNGFGVGLHASRRIALTHGGELRFQETPKSFIFQIPILGQLAANSGSEA